MKLYCWVLNGGHEYETIIRSHPSGKVKITRCIHCGKRREICRVEATPE